MKFFMEIAAEHVRNPHSMGIRNWTKLRECMGRLLPGDVGKRCYVSRAGHVQCENDAQLAERRKGES